MMRKWTGITLGLAAILLFSTVVYAQSRFELNAWSVSNTPAVAGTFSTERYSLLSGMPLVSATATPVTGQDSTNIYLPLVDQ